MMDQNELRTEDVRSDVANETLTSKKLTAKEKQQLATYINAGNLIYNTQTKGLRITLNIWEAFEKHRG
ncbi:MAG: hypothetical protein HN909_05415 [Phycisphaerales bacterium]|jgi:hypothetical protein|nr:hypothetical protein [Phycisphaerales bacterium]MBT7171192.1 hypothetical protein [Phycisphaerales bacterium]